MQMQLPDLKGYSGAKRFCDGNASDADRIMRYRRVIALNAAVGDLSKLMYR
jgi:hypothetical protein